MVWMKALLRASAALCIDFKCIAKIAHVELYGRHGDNATNKRNIDAYYCSKVTYIFHIRIVLRV